MLEVISSNALAQRGPTESLSPQSWVHGAEGLAPVSVWAAGWPLSTALSVWSLSWEEQELQQNSSD